MLGFLCVPFDGLALGHGRYLRRLPVRCDSDRLFSFKGSFTGYNTLNPKPYRNRRACESSKSPMHFKKPPIGFHSRVRADKLQQGYSSGFSVCRRVWAARDLGPNPRNLRTHTLRLLGPKTILYKACGLF